MGFKQSMNSLFESIYYGWKECCKELGKAVMNGWRPY